MGVYGNKNQKKKLFYFASRKVGQVIKHIFRPYFIVFVPWELRFGAKKPHFALFLGLKGLFSQTWIFTPKLSAAWTQGSKIGQNAEKTLKMVITWVI